MADIPISNEQIRNHVKYQFNSAGVGGEEATHDRQPAGAQNAVTSHLPLWKFYRSGSNYVIPYVEAPEIGKFVERQLVMK